MGANRPAPSWERGAGPEAWTDDLTPIGKSDWSYARAAHLLERAGFGGTPEEIAHLAAMTPAEAVAYLVDYEKIDASKLPAFVETGIYPEGIEPFMLGVREAIPAARRDGEALGVKVKDSGPLRYQAVAEKSYFLLFADQIETGRLAHWWANRMVTTPRPLEERMTFFWHDHFATSNQKIRYYKRMKLQNETLRRYATANFKDLLIAASQDPAMIWWLDNRMNVKAHPNENFAREIMELFALGVGNYTEKDIREAARAFTGWTEEKLQFVDRKEHHDEGEKTIFGRTGNFDGYDVIDMILEQEAAPRFIAGKLYKYFSREELSPEMHARLAKVLRDNDFELKPFLTTLFLSRDFYSPASFATQIKSPVLLAVSTFRKLGLDAVPGAPDFRAFCQVQGEELFYPPNVAGWTGGRTWINPATLIERANYLDEVLFPEKIAAATPRRPGGAMMDDPAMEGAAQRTSMSTEEPMGGQSMTVKEAARNEAYNTPSAGRAGRRLAAQTVKPDRTPAKFDLGAQLRAVGVGSAEEAVDHLELRFLRVPMSKQRRAAVLEFARGELGAAKIDYEAEGTEAALRQLLHLIVSAPEFQLS